MKKIIFKKFADEGTRLAPRTLKKRLSIVFLEVS